MLDNTDMSVTREPDSTNERFQPGKLDKTVIAIPLMNKLNAEDKARSEDENLAAIRHSVIIDLNHEHRGNANEGVVELVRQAMAESDGLGQGIDEKKTEQSGQYVFANLEGAIIRELVRRDNEESLHTSDRSASPAIHSIWPDFKVSALLTKSCVTVKADAAWAAFSALGEDIVWAIVDSGIDKEHPHFRRYHNLDQPAQEAARCCRSRCSLSRG